MRRTLGRSRRSLIKLHLALVEARLSNEPYLETDLAVYQPSWNSYLEMCESLESDIGVKERSRSPRMSWIC
jgi:hypothetical protein